MRGEVHTNNIENFWSLLKRGVVGTFHNVSKEYLPLYLNEFSFRFNERNNPDIFTGDNQVSVVERNWGSVAKLVEK